MDGLTQVDTAVRAAESLTVKATNTSTLEATAVGASAAGTGSGLALSVGAAVAGNKTLGAVEAYVDNSVLSVSGTGAQMARLSVAAQDGSTLKAKAVGASLAFSMQGGSVAVGATDVKNVAAASVQARVSGATITVSDGVSVTAKETATVDSVSVAASAAVALTGVAVSGAGAGSSQVVANETGSRLTGSTVTAGTGVSVTAENTSTITAVTGAVAASVTGAGLGASMGVSIASNTFGAYSGDGVTRTNGAQAYIANSTVTVAKGNLDVLATSSETLNSVNFAGALAVVGAGVAVAGSGVQVSNRYASNTSAYIDGSTITVGIDGERGSLTVRAKDDSIIERSAAYGVAASLGLAPGASVSLVVSLVDTTAENTVSAYIGTAGGKEVGAYDNLSVLALEKTQFKNLEAVTASVAASAGVAGAGAGVRVTNNTRNNVSARITGNGKVGALGALAVKAATNVLAEIDLTQVSVAVGVIGAAVGVGIAENISRDTTTASVSEAQVSAPSVSVDALVAVDFSRTQTAGVAATTGLAVNVNKAKVDIGATTLAEARNGAVLNGVGVTTASGRTPGLVSVNAQGTYYGKAYSKAITGGVIGVGVMSAETVLQGSLKAVVDNASLRGDVVGVTARATTDRNGEAGLLAEARSLEVGGLTISVDSARLSTSLDARVEISNRAQIEGTLLNISASQAQSVGVSMDAGTIALVAGRQGKIEADIGGSSYVGIGGGARVIGNKVDIRASNTVRGESALSAYSVKLVGADVSKHDVKIRPQSVIEVSGARAAGDTIDTAGATVVQARGTTALRACWTWWRPTTSSTPSATRSPAWRDSPSRCRPTT